MILISSLFTLMFRVSILLSLMIKAVSSAKNRTRNDEAFTMSLIYIENKVGPRIEPCGTPHLISFNEDFTLLVYTY